MQSVRFGARTALLTAAGWLVLAIAVGLVIAPTSWKLRVLVFGVLFLTPVLLALWPSPVGAFIAAGCWAVPGVLLIVLEGLGGVWLLAAAGAFTGGISESHRRRYPSPGAG